MTCEPSGPAVQGEIFQPAALRSSSGNAVARVRPPLWTRAAASPSSVTNVSMVPLPLPCMVTVMSALTLQPASATRHPTTRPTRISLGTTLHYRRDGRLQHRRPDATDATDATNATNRRERRPTT